jgi:membrane-bound lytic murein transglycosylase B
LRTLRIALATGVATVTMAQLAAAADPATTTSSTTTTLLPSTTTTTTTTTTPTTTPTTGVTVTPVPVPNPGSTSPKPGGNQPSGKGKGSRHKNGKEKGQRSKAKSKTGGTQAGGAAAVPPGGSALGNLSLSGLAPTSCTAGSAAPLYLLPIYQRASDTYGLGPLGPGVLAAINGIESGFGANLGPSSAGAVGWMQFLPSTWAVYGVDANGDGRADPNDPQDAIFAAARYLQAAGMPADTPGAIYSYNHAGWYVADVLSNAACYSNAPGVGNLVTAQGTQALTCKPAPGSHIPLYYMQAFEDAAGRYGLGARGVWALAGVARLESNFGRTMSPQKLLSSGPLGLDRDEWNRFGIDGDGDGRIEHVSVEDSAATLAREIWAEGDLRSGLFLHNQAQWDVEQVLQQANRLSGHCKAASSAWNVSLPQVSTNPLPGWQRGRIDMGVDFSAAPGTPILSPFNAVVVKVGASGWPGGGGGVLLQPAHGQFVYIYESVESVVRPGQRVLAGQKIGFGGPTASSTGIEIGFADANGSPLAAPVYSEGDVTAWGQRMALFLSELGVP